MNKKNIVIGAVCLILGLAVGWYVWYSPGKPGGIAGEQFIEDYVPAIKYTGGIQTALPIEVGSSTVAVGTSTPSTSADLIVNSVATSTIMIDSSGPGKGSCLQMRATDGTQIRIYATSTPIAPSAANLTRGLVVEAGACEQ